MHDISSQPLWTRARALFARAVARFVGDDGDRCFVAHIASLLVLPRAFHRELYGWLAQLEHVVRKLLLAEAATLARMKEKIGVRIEFVTWRHPQSAEPQRAKAARAIGADPQTWDARFSFALPRNPHLVTNANAPRIRALWGAYTPPPMHEPTARDLAPSPFRLARRFEALRRVLEDPAPHARRLAHALAREGRRQCQLLHRYLWSPARTGQYDPYDERLRLDALAHAFTSCADTS